MTQIADDDPVTVLLADISGSTSLYQRVGNQAAHDRISACLATLKEIVHQHEGTFVHSRGDDVLCTFADPDNALRATVDMLASTDGSDLLVHIGLDRGPVIRARDDIFGHCVNVAARLAGMANQNEALCGENTREAMTPANQALLHFFATRRLRGTSEPANIYRYAAPTQTVGTQIGFDADAMSALADSVQADATRAELIFQHMLVHCPPHSEILIGRAADCDLVIDHPWVSRHHAVVEVRDGHAYLKDISSNGIYVAIDGQPPMQLRRETMLLPAVCTLSPTNPPTAKGAALISCRVTSEPL